MSSEGSGDGRQRPDEQEQARRAHMEKIRAMYRENAEGMSVSPDRSRDSQQVANQQKKTELRMKGPLGDAVDAARHRSEMAADDKQANPQKPQQEQEQGFPNLQRDFDRSR